MDPFAIDIASGPKLVQFELVATRIGTGVLTTIYDFRTDQSNPAPFLDDAIIICSMHYASARAGDIRAVPWDIVDMS